MRAVATILSVFCVALARAAVSVPPPPDEDALFALDAAVELPSGYCVRGADGLYERLRPRAALTTALPLDPQQSITLELQRFDVAGAWTQFVVADDAGERRVAPPELLLFRGRVSGQPESWAFVGITPTSINAYFHLAEGVDYLIAPAVAADGQRVPVIYHRQTAAQLCGPIEDLRCALDTPAGSSAGLPPAPSGPAGGGGPRGGAFRVADVALDADWEFRQLFDTANDALAYMSLLTAVVSTIYERDVQLKLALVYARVWDTVSDPYVTSGDTAAALGEFRNYWIDNMGWLPRSIAHLMSGRGLGGGLAELASVCNDNLSYGVSGNLVGAFPYPLQSPNDNNWDLYVVGHEMGHNFGSVHTHCFAPPIDTCAGDPPGIDCAHPQTCQVGTLMSYCHGCPGNLLNIDLRVHPRCAQAMRAYFESTCLRIARNPCYVNHAWVGVEQGSAALPFNSIQEGAHYVLPGGQVRIAAGAYHETFPDTNPLNRAMTLMTSGGTVRIGE